MSLATHAPAVTTTATADVSPVAWAELDHSQASPLSLTFTLPSGQTFNGSAAVRLEVRAKGNVTATPEAIVSATSPTGSSLTLALTSAQMNLPVAGDATTYNAYLYSESSGVHLLVWRCKLRLVADETAASDAGTPPEVSALWLTEAVADTLYAPIGGASAAWGGITGTLGDQTDLQAALEDRVEVATFVTAMDEKQSIADALTVQFDLEGQISAESVARAAAISAASDVLIPKSILTTKGDLITCQFGGIPLRLGAGANTYILTADSTQTGGIKWAAPFNPAAPGAIGGTTASTGAFTSVTATGNVSGADGSFDIIRTKTGGNAQINFTTNGYYSCRLSGMSFRMNSSSKIQVSDNATDALSGTVDLGLERLSAGVWAFTLGTSGTWGDAKMRRLCFDRTDTAAGTTGAQTINKGAGTVNFAAGATSLVVTNSLVTATTKILATVQTNDTTAKSVAVVAASGSFTLYLNAAATAETAVAWQISG